MACWPSVDDNQSHQPWHEVAAHVTTLRAIPWSGGEKREPDRCQLVNHQKERAHDHDMKEWVRWADASRSNPFVNQTFRSWKQITNADSRRGVVIAGIQGICRRGALV